jgi:hypothetical protein
MFVSIFVIWNFNFSGTGATPMPGTVIFLGAGATKSVKGPLTNEILKKILYPKTDPSLPSGAPPPPKLRKFVETLFHVNSATPIEQFPGLPLLMSLLDTALDRRQAFHPDWDRPKLSNIRQAIEIGMFELLEAVLRQAPTNNHYDLLSKVYPAPAQPCVISTNYDLIIDAAMMWFSEARTPDGLLPDYRIGFRTPFYEMGAGKRFGTLLKLHGSLNWLHCRTCQRMEMGPSGSIKYRSVLGRIAELKDFYTQTGAACPTCKTRLSPLLIAPTHFKDYRNPHLAQVWYDAERVLREADKVIFIGYGLPDDDVEVVYLLKRSLGHLKPDKITVVEFDGENPQRELCDHAVGRRYRTLFGDGLDWHAAGVDVWLGQLAAAQTNVAQTNMVQSNTTPINATKPSPRRPRKRARRVSASNRAVHTSG